MNCNELKSVYIDRTGDWVRSGNDTGKFYLKEEVDAVIAELKQKLESVQASMYCDVVDANMENIRLKRELRRNKLKRCLDKAKWCEAELWNIRNTPLCDMNSHEIWRHDDEFWQRWYERWAELAEKIKEAK